MYIPYSTFKIQYSAKLLDIVFFSYIMAVTDAYEYFEQKKPLAG